MRPGPGSGERPQQQLEVLLVEPGKIAAGAFEDAFGQRALAVLSCSGLLLVATGAIAHTALGAIEVYRVGDWPAPFGIALVLDRLAALMLALTAVVALATLAAATTPRTACWCTAAARSGCAPASTTSW